MEGVGMGAYLSLCGRGVGWALINFFLPLGWALIRGGRKFEVGRLFE